MDTANDPKMEQDFTNATNECIQVVDQLLSKNEFNTALEKIASLEKDTRLASDIVNTGKLLEKSVEVSFKSGSLELLMETLKSYFKKRSQLKAPLSRMVNKSMQFLELVENQEMKVKLITTLLDLTEGKIFVEVERARLTQILAVIHELNGNIKLATDTLHSLQIETFGSMDKREKTKFLLEQMRLSLSLNDSLRSTFISRKFGNKVFEEEANEDLKLDYCNKMVQLSLLNEDYLSCCKYYMKIYDSPSVSANPVLFSEAFKNSVIFSILATFSNEQSDILNRISRDRRLVNFPKLQSLMKAFLTKELMRWPLIEELYGPDLTATYIFNQKDVCGANRWHQFRQRVIEHNIRVVAAYYARISLSKLSILLDLEEKEAEDIICSLVVKKALFAKIDRPDGSVNFAAKKTPNDILNEWSHNVNEILKSIVKANHLITKEEMVHFIMQK